MMKTMNGLSTPAIVLLVGIILLAIGLYFYTTQRHTTDLAVRAEQYCAQADVAEVAIAREEGLMRVTSSQLGGGSAYYPENGGQPTSCPVVGPESMSEACERIMQIKGWEVICTPAENAPTDEQAEITGFDFMRDATSVSPSSPNPQAQERAYAALSESAKAGISQEQFLADIAQFLGVQDMPDNGVSVEDLERTSRSEAVLTVGLNYSGGRQLRDVYLVVEGGAWKVDAISVPEGAERFDMAGNLVKDNPGMEPGVWHLVHERPGAPALSVKLEFTPRSICAEGVENMTCVPETLERGQRVHILGEQLGESVVRVTRLQEQ